MATYRSIDGANNNPNDSSIGKTNEPLLRKTDFAYGDGISSLAGADRPGAREISNKIFAQSEAGGNTDNYSDFLWMWGQFLDHDITLTPAEGDAKAAIPVPQSDPFFDPAGTGTQTIGFTRSVPVAGTGTDAGNPRGHDNVITPLIDASNIYGSDAVRAAALREADGHLKTSANDLLPFNTDGLPNAPSNAATLFLAGDVRANENIGLTSLHTLFVREHNRLVDSFKNEHPEWTGETLYQEAKRIVEAEVQAITYNEFLPKLVGKDALSGYDGYKADVDPQIAAIFSTAAYRVGHTMLSPTILRVEENGDTSAAGNLALRDAFFRPDRLSTEGGIGDVLRGAGVGAAEQVDARIVDDVRNFLFGPPGAGGFDLAALNIQRGRDHGLTDYNSAREAFGLDKVTSFAEITSDADLQKKLEALFGTVDNIDVFVGGLAEDHADGAVVGELFQTVIVDQFTRIRDGDSFWYENRLNAAELQEIRDRRLSDIIERNTDVEHMQDDVFFSYARIGGDDADNTVYGGADSDLIIGAGGNDDLLGQGGDDQLMGDAGSDSLYGDAGADILHGGAEDDQLHGEDGADVLKGESGDDFLTGGEGNDYLDGGEGDDFLIGGAGDDVFAFSAGNDQIQGFESGSDKIDLSKVANISEFADAKIESYSSGTLVEDQQGNTLWLSDVTGLTRSDVILAGEEVTGGVISAGPGGVLSGTTGDDRFLNTNGTQYAEGREGNDTFIVEGVSSDFTINKTEDGQDYVIWTHDEFDLLYDIENVEFDDVTITLDADFPA